MSKSLLKSSIKSKYEYFEICFLNKKFCYKIVLLQAQILQGYKDNNSRIFN